MKGLVFTEFIEFVEDTFTPEVADRIIEASDLASGGVYTSLGNYDHDEMVQLVTQLSTETGVAVPDLLRTFGAHLFGRFVVEFPFFFEKAKSAFDFLQTVDSYIHVEVRKLYADVELPRIECEQRDPGHLTVTYRSTRPFADLAEGLITGCIAHFGEELALRREDVFDGRTTVARFSLTNQG